MTIQTKTILTAILVGLALASLTVLSAMRLVDPTYAAGAALWVLGYVAKGPNDHPTPPAPPPPFAGLGDGGSSSSSSSTPPAVPPPPDTTPATPAAKRAIVAVAALALVGGAAVACASTFDPAQYAADQERCIDMGRTRLEIDACRASVRERYGLPPRDAGMRDVDAGYPDGPPATPATDAGASRTDAGDAGDAAASSPRDGGAEQ